MFLVVPGRGDRVGDVAPRRGDDRGRRRRRPGGGGAVGRGTWCSRRGAGSHRRVHDSSGPRRSIRSNPVSAEPRSISAAVARRFLVIRHLLVPPRSLPAEPGSVMRVVDRLGSLQFDPHRRRRPQPRPDAAGAHRRLSAHLDRRAPVPRPRAVRDVQQDAVAGAHGRAPVVPDHVGPPPRGAPRRGVRRPRAARRGAPRAHPDGRAAVVDGHRAARGDRLVLAADQPGARAARGARGGRAHRDLAARGQPPRLRPDRAAVPGGAAGAPRAGRRAAAAQAAVPVSRQRAAGRDRASTRCGWASARRPSGAACTQELVEAGAITPVAVEGLRGPRFVVTDELPLLDAAEAEVTLEAGIDGPARPGGCEPGAAFLAPLDPLVWDRDLLERLFGFEYRWEVYVPAPKRRWGYYVLPLLYGDRFVGRIEPRGGPGVGHAAGGGPVVGGGVRSARAGPRGTRRVRRRRAARACRLRGGREGGAAARGAAPGVRARGSRAAVGEACASPAARSGRSARGPGRPALVAARCRVAAARARQPPAAGRSTPGTVRFGPLRRRSCQITTGRTVRAPVPGPPAIRHARQARIRDRAPRVTAICPPRGRKSRRP